MRAIFLTLFAASSLFAEPTLTVRGDAVVSKPADQFVLSMGVTTDADGAKKALQENNQKMNQVIGALKQLELEDTFYETGSFQISPKKDSKEYRVTNTLIITSGKINSAGTLIDALTQAGANTVDSLRFELKQPKQNRDEAIQAATAQAIRDAKVLAKAAGSRLKSIQSLSLDQASIQQSYMLRASATPIEAGNVEVRASVTMVYEIDSV